MAQFPAILRWMNPNRNRPSTVRLGYNGEQTNEAIFFTAVDTLCSSDFFPADGKSGRATFYATGHGEWIG
jgi:hypothetical protein